MPNWKRLVAEGVSFRLKSFLPMLSPVVWTTIATGVGPDVHGVLDFQELDARTGAKVPISGLSRQVPAVWDIASSEGIKVGVVGWWASHPAERVNGFFVSDRPAALVFASTTGPGVASPPSLDGAIARVVARDGRIGAGELSSFLDVPPDEIRTNLAGSGGMENRIVALSRILGATRVNQRLARDLYDRERPDLLAVYFEGTDEIGHLFAPMTPPRLACVSDEDYRRYHRVVEAYFGVIDRILGQWMRRAKEDGGTLIVNSDHGFDWGADRPCGLPSSNGATAAFWHRMEGVLAVRGAGVRPSPVRGDASVFDLAPTVLALLGLPADVSMPGKPVLGASGAPPREKLFARTSVDRVPDAGGTPQAAGELTKKLLALGYLSGSDARSAAPTVPGGVRPGVTEIGYDNLGIYQRDTLRDLPAAERSFRKALDTRPGYEAPMFNMAVLDRTRGDDRAALDWLFRSFAAGHPGLEDVSLHWAAEYRRLARPEPERELLSRALAILPESQPLARSLGELFYRRHDCRRALDAVRPYADSTDQFQTLNALGVFESCLGDNAAAEKHFARSLALHPGQEGVRRALESLRNGRAISP